jgi:regulator of replication initiation timing
MNNEVEAYVGELRKLREENESLRTKLKNYEIDTAWKEHDYKAYQTPSEKHYNVQWFLHDCEWEPK